MRFLVRHNRHHKVSRSSHVTKLLLFCEELGLGGHFVMPIQCPRNLIMRVYWTTLVEQHKLMEGKLNHDHLQSQIPLYVINAT